MQRLTKTDRVSKRRQDPVSCKLCRVKKLKCNRQQPCSNCLARGNDCEFDSVQAVSRQSHSEEPTNTTILARLQRLEDLVLRMGQGGIATPESVEAPKPAHVAITNSPVNQVEERSRLETQTLVEISTNNRSTVSNTEAIRSPNLTFSASWTLGQR